MTEELAIPTEEFLTGLRELYRQWRAQGGRLDVTGRLPSTPGASNVAPIVQAIEVTSSTADAYGYPARIQIYNGSTWSDEYAEVRAVQIGSTIAGAVLATGFYPPGRLMGVSPTGLHIYGVHPGAAASGGTEWKALTFTSDTGSTADSDPGNGLFKWNHATQGSATVLYFDDLTEDGVSTTTYFASLPATGFIRLQQYSDSTKWQLWKWTLITDASGYTKFTVVLQMNGGTIADGETVLVEFMPLSAGTLIIQEEDGTPGDTFGTLKVPNSKLTDNLDGTCSFRPVKVSANDTTDGFLNGKLVNDTTIDFTENNDGGDETLTLKRAAIGGTLSVPAGSNTGRVVPVLNARTGWANDTPYQPNANNHTIVIATGLFGLQDGDNASVTLKSDSSNPPTTIICQASGQVYDHDDTDATHEVPWTMVGIVLPGHYYMVEQNTNNGTPGFAYHDPLQEWKI